MPNLEPLHDAIDEMIPLIPEDYVDRETVVNLLLAKKQESIDNIKTQKVLRREVERQILNPYFGPLQLTPAKVWVDEVAKVFYGN